MHGALNNVKQTAVVTYFNELTRSSRARAKIAKPSMFYLQALASLQT
jgi:hypothetical protein